MLPLPTEFISVIAVFAPVFSRPVWQHVQVLLTDAVLAPGKRTVTVILRIMGLSAELDFQTYHRVLNRAARLPLSVSNEWMHDHDHISLHTQVLTDNHRACPLSG